VASIGESVTFTVELANESSTAQQLLVDLRVHFVKANGRPSPKVFALKELEVEPGGSVRLTKTISLAQHTTRTHYPGKHRVEVVVNGRVIGSGAFEVMVESRIPTS
jgi:outer membrane usher protein FimD/PapC